MRFRVLKISFVLLMLLTGCRSQAPEPTAIPPTPIPDDVIAPDDMPDYGLVAGGYSVSVVGAVSGITSTTNPLPIEYGSAINGMRRVGTNASGNVGLRIVATLSDGSEGILVLEFAGDIGTGTHQIGTQSDFNPAPVGASFRVSGRNPFESRVSGTLTLDFINRRSINGEFDLTLLDADGQSVTIRGAFHRVPFSPHEDYSLDITGVYQIQEFEPQFSKGVQGTARFITLRFLARRAFSEPEAGTITITAQNYQSLMVGEYDVTNPASPVSVTVRIGATDIPIQSGTILFIRTQDVRNGVQQSIWQGAISLEVDTPAGDATLTGLFNHFDES